LYVRSHQTIVWGPNANSGTATKIVAMIWSARFHPERQAITMPARASSRIRMEGREQRSPSSRAAAACCARGAP
jgi:hypothetical protein